MRRETYSSLKAVWGARRVAARFLYREPIEVIRQDCPRCGRVLALAEMGADWVVECDGCHERVKLAGHVATAVDRARILDGGDHGHEWGEWVRQNPVVSGRDIVSDQRVDRIYGAVIWVIFLSILAFGAWALLEIGK